jgi:hypothetical protein
MQGQWKTEYPVLARLASDIDAAKRELGVENAFVRLSSRSPKDAALSRAGTLNLVPSRTLPLSLSLSALEALTSMLQAFVRCWKASWRR